MVSEFDEPRPVREPVRPRLRVAVEVETPYTPAPPLDTRSWEEVSGVFVARPVHATLFAVRMSGELKVRGCSGVYPKMEEEAEVCMMPPEPM